jgi:Uri superfamily endonuclease
LKHLRSEKGTYALLLRLSKKTVFPIVGPFGKIALPGGLYIYLGSAHGPGGVRGRHAHHARDNSHNPHWHLDYVRHAMDLVEVWATYDPVKRECQWSQLVHTALGGAVPVPGLGSADCDQCEAHFYHFRGKPCFRTFQEAITAAFPGHATVERARAEIHAPVPQDGKLAQAIDIIVNNCGNTMRRIIESGNSGLSPQEVCIISRMAPERQQYEMKQVAEGRRSFRKPREGDPAFDTINFKEVVSRLRRAQGLIRKVHFRLPELVPSMAPEACERMRLAVDGSIESGHRLSELLRLPLDEGQGDSRCRLPSTTSPAADGRAYAFLAAARGFIEKNVRDLPRLLLKGTQATAEEASTIAASIAGIDWHAKAARRLLTRNRGCPTGNMAGGLV